MIDMEFIDSRPNGVLPIVSSLAALHFLPEQGVLNRPLIGFGNGVLARRACLVCRFLHPQY